VIDRRTFITSVAFGLVAVPLAADAQPAGKVPRIGWLGGPTRESAEPFVRAFQRGFKDLGWVEGQNIVLWNPATPGNALALREAEIAARALGVELQVLEARTLHDFDSAFAAISKKRAGALLVLGDVMFTIHRIRLADLAAKARLPAMYGTREYVEAGGLMSYGPITRELFRRAASYVDKILKGANPGELPVEQPTKFELVINMKTAKALGLTIRSRCCCARTR